MNIKRNIVGFFVISILGTLFHFMYELLGRGFFAGWFFPVNESTWEHLKLIFYPTVLYSVIDFLTLKEKTENYIFATIQAILWGMLTIIVLFYTYTGVLGFNVDFLNILIFYISVVVVLNKRNQYILDKKEYTEIQKIFLGVIFMAIIFLFAIFTIHHPNLNIFIPPTSILKKPHQEAFLKIKTSF